MTVVDSLASVLPAIAMTADAPATPAGGRPPDAVVRPGSTEEVAALMQWAAREGVGVLPTGSGRRTRPVREGGRYIVLRTDELSGIEDYEAADLTLSAGAGTPFRAVAEALAANGQWAPFDPPRADDRFLGGLVATGLSGPLQTGYGDLRNHVLGLTVVTGDGRVLRLGGRVVKNVAGFDVLKSVVGSRGSLAVITSAVLRAFPMPPVDRFLVLGGTSVSELLTLALEVGTAPILPVSAVLVDALAEAGGGPALVVRLHGAGETVDADQRRLEAHVGASFRNTAVDAATLRDHAAEGEAVVTASTRPSRLAGVVEALNELAPAALNIDSYGGRVRATLAVPDPSAVDAARSRIEELGGALRLFAPAMGREAFRVSTRPRGGEAVIIAGLQTAFDPDGVLWPARL